MSLGLGWLDGLPGETGPLLWAALGVAALAAWPVGLRAVWAVDGKASGLGRVWGRVAPGIALAAGLALARLGRPAALGLGLAAAAATLLVSLGERRGEYRTPGLLALGGLMFLCCGPALAAGLYYAFSGRWSTDAFVLGLPGGFLAVAAGWLGRVARGGPRWTVWPCLPVVWGAAFVTVVLLSARPTPGALALSALAPLPLALAAQRRLAAGRPAIPGAAPRLALAGLAVSVLLGAATAAESLFRV